MGPFLKRLSLFLAIQAACLAAVVGLCPPDDNHYLAATIEKHRILAQAPTPRVICVGGSNVAFGLDSSILRDELGLSPVNMGLHHALGLDFMLEEVEGALRPGDVVVVSPEYDLLWTGEGHDDTILVLLEHRPSSVGFIGPRQVRALVEQGLPAVSRKLRCALSRAGGAQGYRPLYWRDAFNAHGDFEAHRDRASVRQVRDRSVRGDVPGVDPSSGIARLNAFARRCEASGARCFLAYPPLPSDVLAASAASIRETHARLQAELDMRILGTPDDWSFPASAFYDSDYHLTGEAVAERTRRLSSALRDAGVSH